MSGLVNAEAISRLYSAENAAFTSALQEHRGMWDVIATRIPSFGEAEFYAFLSSFPTLRQWLGDKVIKKLAVQKYELRNLAYESTISIDRHKLEDAMRNGTLANLIATQSVVARAQGQAAGRWYDDLTFAALAAGTSALCWDGLSFFNDAHPVDPEDSSKGTYDNLNSGGGGDYWYLIDANFPLKPILFQEREAPNLKNPGMTWDSNLHNFMTREVYFGIEARGVAGYGWPQCAYASNQALTDEFIDSAIDAMVGFKNDAGAELRINPTHIVVGKSNRAAARDLFKRERLASGASNPHFGALEVIFEPSLT